MATTKIRLLVIWCLLLFSCSSHQEIDDHSAFEVIKAQIQEEARFDRSNKSEVAKIKLLSVEVLESKLLPKLLDADRDKYRILYKAEIEALQDCSWGTDRDNPRGFTRFIAKPKEHKDNWMHITNATDSRAGDKHEVAHYFELIKTNKGWLDAYGNYY